ncbi:MAG: hypothetical protein AB8G22_03815, partial [Saprospiraceae bacterium]
KSVADFKELHHEYVEGVIIKANYLKGKNSRVHVYEYEVRGVKYEGSIGYLKLNAQEGDSCVVIYEFENPKRSTIHFMKSRRFIKPQ